MTCGLDERCVDGSSCNRFKRVFVTSVKFSGNLNGTQGADAKCEYVAQVSNTGGSWTAWLSTSTENAIDRIANNGPWYNTQKALVFANRDGLRRENLSAIVFNELGHETNAAFAWTGTALGLKTSQTCVDWQTTAAMGTAGNASAVGPDWSDAASVPCDQERPLYCFEK